MKKCARCGKDKPEASFYWVDRAHSRRRNRCIACTRFGWREKRKQWIAERPPDFPFEFSPEVQAKQARAILDRHGLSAARVKAWAASKVKTDA